MSAYAQWMFDQLHWRDNEPLCAEWADMDKILRVMVGRIIAGDY
jgi:hypothetical protein